MALTFEPTVVVVGSVNLDTTIRVAMLPLPGETVLAATNHRRLEGKGANQAVAAAEAGASVGIVCAPGEDHAAAQALRWLRSRAVEVRPVRDQTRPTGRAWVMVDDHGENAIIVDRCANAALTPDLAIAAVLDRTRARGGANATLVAQADIARRWGIDVIITLGAEGAAIISPDGGIRRVPAPPVDVVVDTSGAGDALVGAVAAALSRGLSLHEAAEDGVAAGARAVRRWGASGIGHEQGSNR
ncbi:ribokinase [Microtetraspora sp. NBRC 13810]|uniref:PfkB family carbohydrate kinase n=1 Tax=Microtetraspora sp. NBRC 13810 TaxID=3030990 RepID=UPI0024A55EB6|nr:PfkB family carbohydrate kinase [Microtetraspora sp. NBRC 13810]GLW11537.1 ribokinase [Microtetraspora sp. NBRC 13810]